MYSDALERKLQPIYDGIDSRNYKNALKHTDAALKKYPGNQLLLSLRAFSLQRTGKSDEALATLQAIVDKGPESERVLHTMTFTYRAAGKPEAIVPAYAAAAEKSPQDLEILKGLFGAYAKDLNFVKQQQIALKLAKAQPEEADRYSWWAIVSLTLQARAAVLATPPGSNAEQLMKLAETMIVRQITKSKGVLPSYEALLLYIDILQGQGRAAEAATLIKETAGTPAGGLKDDSRQLLAAALVRSRDLSAAAELFKLACLENTDDWWSWQLYLNCILPSSVKHASSELNTPGMVFSVGIVGGLAEIWDAKHLDTIWEADASAGEGKGAGQPPPLPLEERIKIATATLEVLKTVSKPGQSRGAVLAPLELACRLHRLGLSTDRHLSEAFVAALPSLCHSFSCAVDLRRYTSHLHVAEDRKWLAEEITKICEEKAKAFEQEKNHSDEGDGDENKNNSNNKAAIKALWCRTNAYALQQELGCSRPPSSAAAVEYAVQLIDLFSSNLALSESLDPKDRGHGEDLVALAAGSLVSATNTRDGNANLLLLTAILALEAAQVRRTVAAPLRLSVCAVYALLNAPAKSTAQLTALDVKSILHESMTGHWALPTLLASASPEADFEKWLSGISNLHIDQVLEASESIFTAYEQGTYSKIPEFVDFWETLGNSHNRWSATAEKNILKLKSQQASTPTLAAIAKEMVENAAGHRPQVDKIRFNEDLSTRPAWFPPAAVDTRLALVNWWEERANDSAFSLPAMPAASEMWWGVAGAAERKVPQAEQWRQAQRHGFARRQATPQLLAGLLQPKLLKREEVTTLVQILGDSWNEQATYPTSNNPSGTLSSPLAISKALFHAGINLHQAIDAALRDAAEMICDQVCATLDEFQQQFSGFLLDITKVLRLNKDSVPLPLLGNSWPALLATLLSEEVQWAAACLPTWAKLIKSSFPSTADNGAQNQFKEKLQNAVHRAGNAIYVALIALKEQLAATSSSAPAATAAEILAKIESTWPQASTLWKYESKFDAKKAVQDVVAEQQAVVNRMNQLTTHAVTSLKQFAS